MQTWIRRQNMKRKYSNECSSSEGVKKPSSLVTQLGLTSKPMKKLSPQETIALKARAESQPTKKLFRNKKGKSCSRVLHLSMYAISGGYTWLVTKIKELRNVYSKKLNSIARTELFYSKELETQNV